jgi:hypothetical protein
MKKAGIKTPGLFAFLKLFESEDIQMSDFAA